MDNGPSNTKDFFASPSLSLSLAGVFRNAAASVVEEVEEGEEERGGVYKGEIFEISSENTGNGRASDEEGDADGGAEENEEVGNKKKRKRKKHHRHTAEQIRVMEALFKESPHPDEKQRQQLSKQLGLAPRQVKFWFQNRRTQIKAIQERHETSLLKVEMEKLQEENQAMRGTINQACCPNCGSAMSSKDTTVATEQQQLRLENARLKAELQKLRGMRGRSREESASSSMCTGNDQDNRSSLDCYSGLFGLEKNQILEIVNHALDELTKMASANEPLWVRSVETGREVLNYDEYVCEFKPEISSIGQVKQSVEASREIGVVFLDVSRLIQAFMDVNQWRDMFPCIISQASTLDVIFSGEGGNRNGAVQLMFAELQMLTPAVPTRELYFFRHCKQLSHDKWAILDVSIDKVEENIDASLMKCRKSPSGCIIEDKANGHCKVTWVEHIKCSKTAVPAMYRPIINNGLAYGAQHWLATLRLQCERRVFFMATNVPSKDSNGVSTLAGRKSILRLAQRMTSSFCQAIGASRHHTWTKSLINGGEEIRFTTRKNIHDPGEPIGLILSVVSSTWLPISSMALYDFLRNDSRRMEWDIMLNGGPPQTIVSLVKGQNRRNSVTLHATKSTESTRMWVLQDGCTNAFESMLIYAPVDVAGMQAVVNGSDSSSMALLPSGFSILPDGLESRPLVITSRIKERNAEQGSLLTIAFQILANASPAAKLSMESVATVNTLISCTLHNIKRALQCDDG